MSDSLRCPHGFYIPTSADVEVDAKCSCCQNLIDVDRFGIPETGICVHCRGIQQLFDRIKEMEWIKIEAEVSKFKDRW